MVKISSGTSVSKSKKILILTPFYEPNIGGAETYAKALVEEARKKYDIFVLTYMPFKGKAPEMEFKQHLFIRRIHWPFKPPKVWKGTTIINLFLVWPKLMRESIRMHKEFEFDTVHAQGIIATSIGLILKWRYKIKLVSTTLALYGFKCQQKGIFKRVFAWMVSFVMNRCDSIFVEGITGYDDLFYAGVRNGMYCFQHWVDTDVLKCEKKQRDILRVLFVGRPIKEKGADVIFEVQNKFLEKRENNISFKYIFDEAHTVVIEEYKKADILVVPSLYAEGFVRVIVEAASCGCAIISSDRGSLKEMVEPFGYVCQPECKDFYNIIDLYNKNRTALRYQQKKAREYAVNNFNSKNAEVMINAY